MCSRCRQIYMVYNAECGNEDKVKKKYRFFIVAVVIASVVWNVYWNSTIMVHTYIYNSEDIPEVFKGFHIVQLTDIHSVRNEKQAEMIYQKTIEQNPDIICITGDLVDSRYYSSKGAEGEALTLSLVKKLVQAADVFYIYGNHEMILLDDPIRNVFKVALEEIGVHIVNNKVFSLTREDSENGTGCLYLAGIQDPSTLYKDHEYAYYDTNGERMEAMLDDVVGAFKKEDFVLLLSHRPEYLELYSQYEIDLCLTGHAHGGQFRIPFIGGVYAPGQGFFPKYTAGCYEKEHLKMYVGTGIGNSVIPVRIFNPPEIVSVILE